MYKITFYKQRRHGFSDTEFNSIVLTKEMYDNLPIIPSKKIFNNKCLYSREVFYEQIRHPVLSFPAIRISNPKWKLSDEVTDTSELLSTKFEYIFVCLDIREDIWIAFKYYNLATVEEAYSSTVNVSAPAHGQVYRLDSTCMDIVRRFYP